TIAELVDWLVARGDGYALAFENRQSLRAAIDKRHASANSLIASAREIAFFPPMTGG
ncbi:MAG: MoaD/ThiS family protein, partial [Methylocystis sp.]